MEDTATEQTDNTALLKELQASRNSLKLWPVFKQLADEWHKRNPGTTNKDLAALLCTRPQAVSQWKSGSDSRRKPPWYAILLLCELNKKQITITPGGIKVLRLRR